MNYLKKLNLHWFCTQNHTSGAIFGPTCMYKKLRNFRTVPLGVTNLVSKCAGNLKEKSHKVSRRELCAFQSNRAKCRGGGPFRPPPPVFLGLRRKLLVIAGFMKMTWNPLTHSLKEPGGPCTKSREVSEACMDRVTKTGWHPMTQML